jgi:hypothetical protein
MRIENKANYLSDKIIGKNRNHRFTQITVNDHESTLGERTEAISADSVRTAGEPTVGERMPPPNT